jgi:hypothetical protein
MYSLNKDAPSIFCFFEFFPLPEPGRVGLHHDLIHSDGCCSQKMMKTVKMSIFEF